MVSLAVVMRAARIVFRLFPKIAIVCSMLFLASCSYSASGGGGSAEGEQHDLPYTAHDSFLLTQDVLRGEGILFEVKPEDKLVTLWKDADVGAGALGSLVGKHPQYRYEIEVVPLTGRSSRVVVNVRVEDIPDEDIAKYNATTRLNLFTKIDQLAAQYPPSEGTPKEGGVNYALLPNEEFQAGLMGVSIVRTDLQNQQNQQTGEFTPDDRATLQQIYNIISQLQ